MFKEFSNFVESTDRAFMIILGIGIFFLVVITIALIWFTIRYRRSRHPEPAKFEGSVGLEILWTTIPMALVLLMFYFGWAGFSSMRNVPDNAMVVEVHSRMWDWEFRYKSGKSSKQLYVPVNQPVKLEMYSDDVLHSLFIPAFRVKEDVVPGQMNYLWFEAKEEGEYDIFCTEYCGLQHSYMTSKAVVTGKDSFEIWVADFTPPDTSEHPGLTILKNNACISCHSLDGKELIAPSFKGLFAKKRIVISGDNEREIIVDGNYIRNSVNDPDAEIVKGFNKGIMQSYKEVLKEEELDRIVEYFESQKE